MAAKLAISFITYNRAKHIREDLEKISDATKKKGIDIYIFDGSTNDATKNVVYDFISKGYDHIYYYHYNDDYESSSQRMKDALLMPDSEYIWFCGDKFLISPKNYDILLDCADKSYDIITIYNKSLNGTKYFSDPVKYVEYCIIPFTHFGATIIKKELIKELDINLRKEYQGFWKMLIYIQAINKSNFKGIAIHIHQDSLSILSKYQTKSGSRSCMWDIWIKDWYNTIINLPERYNKIKEEIINRPDKDLHFFSFTELMKQRAEGQFDLKKCLEYREYISQVIVMPDLFVYFISMIPRNLAKKIVKIFNNLSQVFRYE